MSRPTSCKCNATRTIKSQSEGRCLCTSVELLSNLISELDAYIKEEDEHPLKLLKEELESEGINIKCVRKRRRKGKTKFTTKKRRVENILPRLLKNDLLPRLSNEGSVAPKSPKEELEVNTNIGKIILRRESE